MGMYKYTNQTWNQREKNALQVYMRQIAIRWRREPTVHRVEHPTRIEHARALGYKAKQGYVVIRVRIRKGGARKPSAQVRSQTEGARRNKIHSCNKLEEHRGREGQKEVPEPSNSELILRLGGRDAPLVRNHNA